MKEFKTASTDTNRVTIDEGADGKANYKSRQFFERLQESSKVEAEDIKKQIKEPANKKRKLAAASLRL